MPSWQERRTFPLRSIGSPLANLEGCFQRQELDWLKYTCAGLLGFLPAPMLAHADLLSILGKGRACWSAPCSQVCPGSAASIPRADFGGGSSTKSVLAGIVQGKGTVAEVQRKADFSSIKVAFPEGRLLGAQIGASVAINGTCLTVRRQFACSACAQHVLIASHNCQECCS